jgi:hypothetical protein
MTLADYLKRYDLSLAAFGARLDPAAGASSVARWRDGLIFPRMKNIKEIERATQGRVTIRDLRRAYDKHRMNGA